MARKAVAKPPVTTTVRPSGKGAGRVRPTPPRPGKTPPLRPAKTGGTAAGKTPPTSIKEAAATGYAIEDMQGHTHGMQPPPVTTTVKPGGAEGARRGGLGAPRPGMGGAKKKTGGTAAGKTPPTSIRSR